MPVTKTMLCPTNDLTRAILQILWMASAGLSGERCSMEQFREIMYSKLIDIKQIMYRNKQSNI